MGMNPVQGIGSADDRTLRSTEPVSPLPAERPEPPDSGPPSKREIASDRNVSPLSEIPQDEVEVQRDSEANDEIVIRYMDHAGNLVLQVPSSQVLNVARGIDQDLARETRSRDTAVATPEGEGGKTHGH